MASYTVLTANKKSRAVDRHFCDAANARPWSDVRGTLRPGDLVLVMGTGPTSWKIATAAYAFFGFEEFPLRYSHIAVVVGPFADGKGKRSLPSSVQSPPPTPLLGPADGVEPIVVEAIDNKDVNIPNVVDGSVAHDQVQLSYLADRIFGCEGPRRCYCRAAVRRLDGFEWTPERREALDAFLQRTVGRPMDKNPQLALAILNPKLHPRNGRETDISCTELVGELYQDLGLWPKPGEPGHVPSVQLAPCHFTNEGLKDRGLVFNDRDVFLRPEEPIMLCGDTVPRLPGAAVNDPIPPSAPF